MARHGRLLVVAVAAVALAAGPSPAAAFHDCVQPRSALRNPSQHPHWDAPGGAGDAGCGGGLCVGMHGGPHEGGPAAYPVGDAAAGTVGLRSRMTVPALPQRINGTYYIWTDIFFGDSGSYARMNQFVPQLILGNALDGSSGAPDYKPHFGLHRTWAFGAHYFFEVLNATSQAREAKAAYGEMFPAHAGETLETSFEATPRGDGGDLSWTLTMRVVGDASRESRLIVDQPYMGLGAHWPVPTTSWGEKNYSNLCINACWELYIPGGTASLPSSGSQYGIHITRGQHQTFPWVSQWDEDEGANRTCARSSIREAHTAAEQHVFWNISV